MKKIIVILMLLLVVSSTAMAATVGATMKYIQYQQQKQQEKLQASEVTGLENAQLRVMNQEQKQLLEGIMEKIQERERNRINQMEELEVYENEEGEVIAEGRRKMWLFGLLPIDEMKVRYRINEDGEIIRFKPGLDFLYGENSLLLTSAEEAGETE